jgi:hypothetical protein
MAIGIKIHFKFTRGDRVRVLSGYSCVGTVLTLRYGADGITYLVNLHPRSGATAWYQEKELELAKEQESSQPAVPPEE